MRAGVVVAVDRVQFTEQARLSGCIDVSTIFAAQRGINGQFQIAVVGTTIRVTGANGTLSFARSSGTGRCIEELADLFGVVVAAGLREVYRDRYLSVLSYWRRVWNY